MQKQHYIGEYLFKIQGCEDLLPQIDLQVLLELEKEGEAEPGN